jgi:hypothetical protein
MNDFERDMFLDFGRLWLEEYAMNNVGAKYNVTQHKDRILIRKFGDPKRIRGIPYYTIGVLV